MPHPHIPRDTNVYLQQVKWPSLISILLHSSDHFPPSAEYLIKFDFGNKKNT